MYSTQPLIYNYTVQHNLNVVQELNIMENSDRLLHICTTRASTQNDIKDITLTLLSVAISSSRQALKQMARPPLVHFLAPEGGLLSNHFLLLICKGHTAQMMLDITLTNNQLTSIFCLDLEVCQQIFSRSKSSQKQSTIYLYT